jgi:hypothetical protein
MVQVAREWKRVSTLPGIVLDPKGGGGLVGDIPLARGGGRRGPATQDPGGLLSSDSAENEMNIIIGGDDNHSIKKNFNAPLKNGGGEQVGEELVEVIAPIRKALKLRPSSWQRRKARRAADEAKMMMEIDGTAAGNGTADGHIARSSGLLSTQPLSSSTVDASGQTSSNPQLKSAEVLVPPAAAVAHIAPPTDGSNMNHYGHTQWPRYMPKPSEMIINRSPIFYCSTFPLKPGFTARRTLLFSPNFFVEDFSVSFLISLFV